MGPAADGADGCQELVVGGSLAGYLVDAVHDEVAEFVGVAAVLDVVHGVDEELLVDGHLVQVVAPHALLDGGDLDHRQSHHENLIPLRSLQRVGQLDPQQLQLLRGQQGHRFGVLQHHLVARLALLQEERVNQFDFLLPVQEDTAHLDVPVLGARPVQVLQTADHTLEDPADLGLGHHLVHLAVVLDLVEETVGMELVAQTVHPAGGPAPREPFVGLQLLHAQVLPEVGVAEPHPLLDDGEEVGLLIGTHYAGLGDHLPVLIDLHLAPVLGQEVLAEVGVGWRVGMVAASAGYRSVAHNNYVLLTISCNRSILCKHQGSAQEKFRDCASVDDRVTAAVLFAREFEYRCLEVVILLHLPDHFVVLLVVEYDLADGEGRGGLELDRVHLLAPQVDLNGGRVRHHPVDVVVVDSEQLVGK